MSVLREANRRFKQECLVELTPEERPEGLRPEKRLQGLRPSELATSLSPAQREELKKLL